MPDRTLEELQRENDELRKHIELIKLGNPRHANKWYRQYGDYVYKRLKEYGYTEMSPELNMMYSHIRALARLRYFGKRLNKRGYVPPMDEEDYFKIIKLIDEILPAKEEKE